MISPPPLSSFSSFVVARHGIDDDALVLIWGEVLLRLQLGDAPTLAEYQTHFPHHADALAMQFELQRQLETEPTQTTPHDTAGVSRSRKRGLRSGWPPVA